MWCDDDSCDYSSDESQWDYAPTTKDANHAEGPLEHEDAWEPCLKTTVFPVTVKRSQGTGHLRNPVYATESPRTSISPHGYSMKTWVHNVKKAVASENLSHLIYCFTTYFAWFNVVESLGDSGVTRVLPLRNKGLVQSLQEKACAGGVFNNRWSAFLHQQLRLVILTTFFELVGVCGPYVIKRIDELWRDYELGLFVYPQRSLSKLLTIAKTLNDSHKNGSVYFASSVFADTALARRKREQMIQNPHVLRYFLAADKAEAAISTLSQLKQVYFKQRHRKRLYKEWYASQDENSFLNTGNITQLIQSVPIPDRKVSKLIALQRAMAQSSGHSAPVVKYLTDSLAATETLFASLSRQPNMFACRRLCGDVLTYSLVYCHLISHLAAKGTWTSYCSSSEEVSHTFCNEVLESVAHTPLVMVYGVAPERFSQPHRVRSVARYKKRKLTAPEQDENRSSGGPNTVAISHQNTYAASTCRDGYLHPADFVTHCNYNHDVFADLESLYFASANFSYFLRHYNKPKHSPTVVTDNTLVDLTRLTSSGNNCYVGYVQKYPKVCSTVNEETVSKAWSGNIDCATVLFDHLCGYRENDNLQQRPRVWLHGPSETTCHEDLQQTYLWQNKLRQLLGFAVGTNATRQLVLQDFPLSPEDTTMVTGKPYTFYTEELPASSVVTCTNDGSRHASSTKKLSVYVDDIRKTAVWNYPKFKKQLSVLLVRLAVLVDALGTPSVWDCTHVFQQFVLRPNGDIFYGPVSLHNSTTLHSVPNKKRSAYAYLQALKIVDNDSDRFQALYTSTVSSFLEAVRKTCPQHEGALADLLDQELELELEISTQ